MYNGFAIALAWPETLCKRAGAWYDYPLHYLKISKNGYYKVGHAAVILINQNDGHCHYFDFGRYHAPHGKGRVRSAKTDHDLTLKTKALFSENLKSVININLILKELYNNPSTHGDGQVYGSVTKVNFDSAIAFVNNLQSKQFITYGPFVPNGTNCSRFVSSVLQAGNPSFSEMLRLKLPLTVSPTPMWNLRAVGKKIISYGKTEEVLPDNSQLEPNFISL